MALTTEFPHISGNSLSNVFGVVDTYNTALYNNGALNPLGGLYVLPVPAPANGGASALLTVGGYGSFLAVKYVRYNSTSNPSVVTGPAVVYWTDETFTTVTGTFSEGLPAGTGNTSSVAGLLLPNSGTVANVGLGTGFTKTVLNGNFVFIAVGGFVPSCNLGYAGTQGNSLMGGTGASFTMATTTGVNRPLGYTWGAVTSQIADVLVTLEPIF